MPAWLLPTSSEILRGSVMNNDLYLESKTELHKNSDEIKYDINNIFGWKSVYGHYFDTLPM